MSPKQYVLGELRKNGGFPDRLGLFVHDLRKFGDNEESQLRLSETGHEFFVGPPYFNEVEATKILASPVGKGSLEAMLKKLRDEKAESGELCASHDLAPIFETVLEVKWAQIHSEFKASKKALKKLVSSVQRKKK